MTAVALAIDDVPEIECSFAGTLLRALIPWGHCGTIVSRGEADPADLARRLTTLYPLAVSVCAYRRDVLSRACRGVDYAVRVIARRRLARFDGWPAASAIDLFSAPITQATAPWIGLAALALRESWARRGDRSEGAIAVLFDATLALSWLSTAIYGDDPRALEIAGRCAASLAIAEGCTIVCGTWEPAERLVLVALGVEMIGGAT